MKSTMASSKTLDKVQLPVLYEDLRKQNVPSDFEIKVGEKSFSVHRKTITTHSEYFRAMLTHDTKENQQGYADVNQIPEDGVRVCIDFMYTGLLDVRDEAVEDILKTADIWQLSNASSTCSWSLKRKLNSGNCVSTLHIATEYRCIELKVASQRIYDKNFHMKFNKLLQLSKDNFAKYLRTSCKKVTAWDAIITWIKHDFENRSKNLLELVKTLDNDEFPSAKLLKRMWAEPLFRDSSQCRKFLFDKVFMDLDVFKRSLGVESYFVLKNLSNEFEHVIKQIKDLLCEYFKHQIVSISQEKEFKYLSSVEILQLFSSEKPNIFAPEKWWWNTAVMWVKHDPTRTEMFPKLIRFINFNQMPITFAKSLLRNEALVKESQECFDMILDGIFRTKQKNKATPYVAVLYSNGKIKKVNLKNPYSYSWSDLTKIPKPVQNPEIFYFNGRLCLINGSTLFYLQDNVWIERSSMSSNSAGQKKVVTHGDFIYVVCCKIISCYDSVMDKWNEIVLPSEIKMINCIVADDDYIYVHDYDNHDYDNRGYNRNRNSVIWKNDLKTKEWRSRSSSYITNFVATDDGIYKMDYHGFNEHDPGESKDWAPFENKKKRKSGCNVTSSLPTLSHMKGKVIRINTNDIESYDEMYEEWKSLSNIPVYSAPGLEGQAKDVVATSACTFSESVDTSVVRYYWNQY